MTNEQKILLMLLGSALNGSEVDIQNPEAVNWQEVMEESEAQAVLPLVFDAVEGLKEQIPKKIYDTWSKKAILYLVKNAKVEASQINLVKLLTDAGYPYMIIKGEVSAHYYNRPDLRVLGDVDFLIDPSQETEIANLLRDNGYTSEMEEHECHMVFKKPNEHLEMHREIQGIPKGTIGDKIRSFLACALQDSVSGEFNIPAKHHHGLILLLHTQHHMIGEGLGLRHLCDLAMFVNKTANEDFWEEKLLPLLRETGLMTFTGVLVKTCSIAFKTSCPTWADADEKLCNKLLEDILSGGNFGRKDKGRVRTGVLIKDKKQGGISRNKYKRMYRILAINTRNKHPQVKKHKILFPIYLLAEIFRYMGLVLIGKRPSLQRLSKDIDKRKSIYQQLKIFEV